MTVIEYEKRNHIVTVTLNRPDRLNALSYEMLDALRDSWLRFERDDDAWIAILTGAGKSFCSGADRALFQQALKGHDMLECFYRATLQDSLLSGTRTKPVIAATKGYVVGGGLAMVLRADFRIIGESTIFYQPEVERGNVMIFAETLPDAIAAEVLCGMKLPAERAYQLGIANRLVTDELVVDTAMEFAEELLRRPPIALRFALKTLRDIRKGGIVIPRAMLDHYTNEYSRGLRHTRDWQEGVQAFLDGRLPDYFGC